MGMALSLANGLRSAAGAKLWNKLGKRHAL